MKLSRLTVAWIGYLASCIFAFVAVADPHPHMERAKWVVVSLAVAGAIILWYASKFESK